jgi:hypothetical protein
MVDSWQPGPMLSRDEEESLSEIEARLRSDSPDLLEMFERDSHDDLAQVLVPWETPPIDIHTDRAAPSRAISLSPWGEPRRRAVLALLVVGALLLAVTATALATFAFGADAGGLVGAVSLPLAGLYSWSLFGCPNQRHRSR